VKPHLAIIAEIKRNSPSKGKLAEITDSAELAQTYLEAGAAAISVLTESQSFSGGLDDLEKVSQRLHSSALPILRKDFIIDELQIVEAMLAGADAVLLIVSILGAKVKSLIQAAKNYGITALVEVHDLAELEIAVESGAIVIGVNNRNLNTLEVNPRHAFELIEEIPAQLVRIAESGINTPELAKEYFQAGFNAVLIGEALVKAENKAGFVLRCR
jgi:indole-3-glycerol phosphate synthase